MFLCLDTRPLVATLLAFTLVMLIWNLQPYYDTILDSPASSTSSKLSITDPNKRTFLTYGNAASLFVQMGDYRGGPTIFAVVGLASKPLHVFGNPNADNKGGKLILYAYYGESPKRYEKITALEEAPGSYNESKFSRPYPYEYLCCGSSLYGNLSASRMREWMAYHFCFFGPRSHFVFHDAGGVSPEVRAVLEPWIRAGRATLQDIRDQAEFDGYYYNQFLVVNDCLHRYRHAANWTIYFDVDEYIYLPDGNTTLESVLREFSNNTQFTIEQNAMSSMLCLNDSSQDYSSRTIM
ncbi:hypothetical protein K7X08_035751 [Anisodus acutangulus]|uniref:Glycosyltransferase family 92 protein n=1 Tax=Anisodus acutangulus TaxID=402998 RepID=A0A9Q1L7L6_9SOLA|nr:hypothetical protein K7X08_035751 [Anisodus acutangulus]